MGDYELSAVDLNTTELQSCKQLEAIEAALPLSTTASEVIRYIQITYYMICYPTVLLLNAFLMFLIARFKILWTTTFFLSLQIIVANLANIIVYFPYSTTNAIANRNIVSEMCPALGFLTSFLQTARTLLMIVLVVDRFLSFILPFWYGRHRVKVVIALSIGGWVMGLTLSLVPLIWFRKCYTLQRLTWVCTLGTKCDLPKCNAYLAFRVTLVNVGTFVAFCLYLALYCRAKKILNAATAQQSNQSSFDAETAREHRKSERRANTTFLLLSMALVGVTIPTYVFVILGRAALRIRDIPQPPLYTIITVLLASLFLLLFVIDPLVIMRDKDVREVIKVTIARLRRRRGWCQLRTLL